MSPRIRRFRFVWFQWFFFFVCFFLGSGLAHGVGLGRSSDLGGSGFLIVFHPNALRVFGFPPLSQVTDVAVRGAICDLPRGLLARISFNMCLRLAFIYIQIIPVTRHLGVKPNDSQATHTWGKYLSSYKVSASSRAGALQLGRSIGCIFQNNIKMNSSQCYNEFSSFRCRLWSKRASDGQHHDIQDVEAIGPLVILATWAELLQGCLWTHYIDNNGALACLVNGSSSVATSDVIVGMTWERIAKVSALPWFDRVDSKSNPVDGLSRGRMEGPWQLVKLKFPAKELQRFLRRFGQ